MPKANPLKTLAAFQIICEAEFVVLIRKLEEIQQFSTRFHDRKRRRHGIIDEHRDATIRVEAQEPFLLLLVGADVDQSRRPLCAVSIGQLLEEDLHFLPIGRGLRDEVEAFGVLDRVRRLRDVEVFGHSGQCCWGLRWEQVGATVRRLFKRLGEEVVRDANECYIKWVEENQKETKYKNRTGDDVLSSQHGNFLISQRHGY